LEITTSLRQPGPRVDYCDGHGVSSA